MAERGGRVPALRVLTPDVPVRAVALVLHGGAQHGLTTVRPWGLAYLRMVALARMLAAAGGRSGLEVCLLRNRVRGWNEPTLHPVLDARWALDRVRVRRPGYRWCWLAIRWAAVSRCGSPTIPRWRVVARWRRGLRERNRWSPSPGAAC